MVIQNQLNNPSEPHWGKSPELAALAAFLLGPLGLLYLGLKYMLWTLPVFSLFVAGLFVREPSFFLLWLGAGLAAMAYRAYAWRIHIYWIRPSWGKLNWMGGQAPPAVFALKMSVEYLALSFAERGVTQAYASLSRDGLFTFAVYLTITIPIAFLIVRQLGMKLIDRVLIR